MSTLASYILAFWASALRANVVLDALTYQSAIRIYGHWSRWLWKCFFILICHQNTQSRIVDNVNAEGPWDYVTSSWRMIQVCLLEYWCQRCNRSCNLESPMILKFLTEPNLRRHQSRSQCDASGPRYGGVLEKKMPLRVPQLISKVGTKYRLGIFREYLPASQFHQAVYQCRA